MSAIRAAAFAAGGLVWSMGMGAVARGRVTPETPVTIRSALVGPSWREWALTVLGGPGMFLCVAALYHSDWIAIVLASFLTLAVVASWVDLRRRIIPNALVYPGLVGYAIAIVVLRMAGVGVRPLDSAVGFLAYGGFLFLLASLWRGGMGMGDVKLAALTGLVLGALGWAHLAVAIAAAILAAGLAAVAVLIVTRNRKRTIPFGPFLAVGAITSALVAHRVASWYLGRIS